MSRNYLLAYFKNFKEDEKLSKTIKYLKAGDFKSAQTKKITNTNYFRAKINYEDRLLFTFFSYQNETYIVLLETILNHEYDKSKFLRGVNFKEEDIDFELLEPKESIYVNKKREFRYIDKFISFSQEQECALDRTLPLLLIGSAGSGKTSVVIEKLRALKGKVLYASLSTYLVKNTKEICRDSTNIDFLTFDDALNKIGKHSSDSIDFLQFKLWAKRHKIRETALYFEEFKGVLTGTHIKAYLTKDEYLALGVRQSLFDRNRRELVYEKFEKYLLFLKEKNLHDSNILASTLLEKVEKRYDYIVIDEVQDFTNIEIYFLLKSLKKRENFIFSGDANQIIYANFFSWSNLKIMLFQEQEHSEITILTKNYRSSKSVTQLSNQLLKIKQLRFGSIDKESNYLIDNVSIKEGEISFHKANYKLYKEFNRQTQNSVDFAIIVFDEVAKKRAKEKFDTPLIFTILEAKGLEYKNVILLNFIEDNAQKFHEIISSINKEDLEVEHLKYARPKDKTNHELERYKIYINALYVAFTRTVENLYIIEQKKHQLLELLNVIESKTAKLEIVESTKEEWLKEAKRLREMGKEEQAERILTRVEYQKKRDIEIVSKKKERLKDRVLRGEGSEKEIERIFKQARKDFDFETIEYLANELNRKEVKEYLDMVDNIPINNMTIRFSYKRGEPLLHTFVARGRTLEGVNVDKMISELFVTFEKDMVATHRRDYKQDFEKYVKRNRTYIKGLEILVENGAKFRNKRPFFSYLKINNAFIFNRIPILFDTCRHGLLNLSRLIIKRGADVNEMDGFRATPLLGAVDSQYSGQRGFISIVQLLLESGADTNIAGYSEKNTPLISASQFGMLEIAKLLLEYGANPNITNKKGFTALFIARQQKDKKMIKLLKKYGGMEEVDLSINMKKNGFKNIILKFFDKFLKRK